MACAQYGRTLTTPPARFIHRPRSAARCLVAHFDSALRIGLVRARLVSSVFLPHESCGPANSGRSRTPERSRTKVNSGRRGVFKYDPSRGQGWRSLMLRLRRVDGVYAPRTTADRLRTASNRLCPICGFRTLVSERAGHVHSSVDVDDFALSLGR